jgi:uncharacterized protein YkwD
MHVKNLLGRKTAALACTALMALTLTACFPDTSSTPPSDPFTDALFNAVNADRVGAGLPPFTWSPKLANNAGSWAWQMMSVNSLYHQNLSALLYSSDYTAYYTLGENILVGPGSMTPQSIEAAWKASPLHWANITNGSFNVIGIGYVRGPDGRIWAVQEFGGL